MDWNLAAQFKFSADAFATHEFETVASEIDVIWLRRGSREVTALFEVEHSTPIYSGLLRFNDVRLVLPALQRFTGQINRPTFRASGLHELCSFLDYANVFEWHKRLSTKPKI
jgi:hypothetical protein